MNVSGMEEGTTPTQSEATVRNENTVPSNVMKRFNENKARTDVVYFQELA